MEPMIDFDGRPKMPPPDALPSYYSQFDFDDTVAYQEPPYLFEYKGTGFSPLGGIQALSGQKKNGKSILVSVLIATVLNGDKETGRFAERFPGLRLRQSTVGELGHEPRILYVDTEQERANTSKVAERAKWLCEIEPYVHVDRLSIQWLREMPQDVDVANERWKAIKWKIEQVNPDIVFIDGIRDIVHDFNDLTESASLINELMSLASRRNMCIWCSLHMNPRPSNDDDSKMRGHLGTELGNKVSDTFVMKKQKNASGITFKCSQIDARGKDVDDFVIELNGDADNDIPNLGAPKLFEAEPQGAAFLTKHTAEELKGWIQKHLSDLVWPTTNKDFCYYVLELEGVTSPDEQKQLVKMALNRRFIIKQTRQEMTPTQKNARLKLNENEFDPF